MSVYTKNWKKLPFTVDGVDFVSLIRPRSEMSKRVSKVSPEIFAQLNREAVRDCIGDVKTMTRDELIKKLEFVNEGASQAFIALA